ncbi:hypothetical protein C1645_840397 [Glomus cerebriforme]|uniref:HTH myb-type domain-containing protein n=1 Tax=Glomus cerebriforme TaxID=658196 RepID=A0A397SB60_9GLOM|nr:hypothetical protein C1645_840397 [Glomus cerebriforme]
MYCKFGEKENNFIRYQMRMMGHLDDCYERISKMLPQYTPDQISNHWRKYLDPDSTWNPWDTMERNPIPYKAFLLNNPPQRGKYTYFPASIDPFAPQMTNISDESKP